MLLNGGWLIDKIIEAYLHRIAAPDVYIMDSIVSKTIFTNGQINKLKNFDFSKYVAIVAPLNINDNHWCLVYISIITKTFSYLDPFGEKKRIANTMLKNWINFAQSNCSLESFEWSNYEMSHSIQKDS
ncbi:unnamed protein product, partial [Brachionus calyciflorus]